MWIYIDNPWMIGDYTILQWLIYFMMYCIGGWIFESVYCSLKEGKLLNREVLSSGTAEGIDVALFLASMMSGQHSFYYCDEHFSYIQSDIEKMIFTLMMERVQNNEQLIFTTHNTDLLELNLPKHSFVFLRKELV